MGFLFPAFLLGALAAGLPILLHLLRRDRAPEVPFTAVRLLRSQPLPRSRRRRLRDLLLLGARVAGLLLLAAAFARPYLAGANADRRLAIIAVDRSYSMGAPERFERARALAREEVDRLPAHRQIAVVAFDDGAEIAAEPGSAGPARRALDALTVGFGGTDYGPLLTRARELAGRDGATLTIVGDLQRRGWDGGELAAMPADIEVHVLDVGPVPANAAVVGVRLVDGGIAAAIQSSHVGAFTTSARLRVDDRVVDEALVTVSGAEETLVTFRHATPVGAAVAVEIEDPHGLPADDVRYVVAPGGRTAARVLVLGGGDEPLYVPRALEAADVGYRVIRGGPSGPGRMAEDDLREARTVVLLSTRGLDRAERVALDRFVREGGGLLVSASGRTDAAVLAATLGWPDFSALPAERAPARLAVTDLRHPIFSAAFGGLAANLGAARFTRHWTLPQSAESGGWDVIARFTDGSPALLERAHDAGRVLLFASDLQLEWNDFPLHAAFVPFVVEAIRYAGALRDAPADYVLPQMPAGVPPRPGVYFLNDSPTSLKGGSTGAGRAIAVNVDIRENSPVRQTAEEFLAMLPAPRTDAAGAGTSSPAADVESRQGYWQYAILLLMAVLVAESYIGRIR